MEEATARMRAIPHADDEVAPAMRCGFDDKVVGQMMSGPNASDAVDHPIVPSLTAPARGPPLRVPRPRKAVPAWKRARSLPAGVPAGP